MGNQFSYQEIKDQISGYGLKVTPQRMAVYEALLKLNGHPSAEEIYEYVIDHHPTISLGTIYKTLETFVEKGLIKRVKTSNDSMRYDPVLQKHHHLYCSDTGRILDYYDDELQQLLEAYFQKKGINNFEIEDFKLQIQGKVKQNS